jgi:hypothetical protein
VFRAGNPSIAVIASAINASVVDTLRSVANATAGTRRMPHRAEREQVRRGFGRVHSPNTYPVTTPLFGILAYSPCAPTPSLQQLGIKPRVGGLTAGVRQFVVMPNGQA